jgi:hypothetical protein
MSAIFSRRPEGITQLLLSLRRRELARNTVDCATEVDAAVQAMALSHMRDEMNSLVGESQLKLSAGEVKRADIEGFSRTGLEPLLCVHAPAAFEFLTQMASAGGLYHYMRKTEGRNPPDVSKLVF